MNGYFLLHGFVKQEIWQKEGYNSHFFFVLLRQPKEISTLISKMGIILLTHLWQVHHDLQIKELCTTKYFYYYYFDVQITDTNGCNCLWSCSEKSYHIPLQQWFNLWISDMTDRKRLFGTLPVGFLNVAALNMHLVFSRQKMSSNYYYWLHHFFFSERICIIINLFFCWCCC